LQVLGQTTTLIYTSRVNYVYFQEFLFFFNLNQIWKKINKSASSCSRKTPKTNGEVLLLLWPRAIAWVDAFRIWTYSGGFYFYVFVSCQSLWHSKYSRQNSAGHWPIAHNHKHETLSLCRRCKM